MVILILSYKPGISLHVPLPINVANARYHSLLDDNIIISGCQPFALVRHATNAWARRPAYQAQGGATPITCVPSPRRSHADNWQLYGRSTLMTGSCTVHFKRDARVYERVQPRLPKVSRCKSALFRSPKGSLYQLVQVVSDTKLSQICCSARDLLYIIRISRVTYSTNTDFSRDLLYKIQVLSTALAYQAFPLTAVHYSNIRV